MSNINTNPTYSPYTHTCLGLVLGLSWGLLGPSWGLLGPILGLLRVIFGASRVLGPSSAGFGAGGLNLFPMVDCLIFFRFGIWTLASKRSEAKASADFWEKTSRNQMCANGVK